MNEPRTTVGIRTVDRLAFAQEAIESVLAQRSSHLSLLVSDNSQDAAYGAELARIVERAGRSRPQIEVRIVSQPLRLSIAEHFNAVVGAAVTEYYLDLSDDDRLRPEAIETMEPLLDAHPDAGFVFCNNWIIDGDGRVDRRATAEHERGYRAGLKPGFLTHRELARPALRTQIPLPGTLFRRDLLSAFPLDTDGHGLEVDMFLRIAESPGPGALFVSERLVDYRIHAANYSGSKAQVHRSRRDVIAALERSRGLGEAEPREYRRALAHNHAYNALGMQAAQGPGHGAASIAASLRLSPLDPFVLSSAARFAVSAVVGRIRRR